MQKEEQEKVKNLISAIVNVFTRHTDECNIEYVRGTRSTIIEITPHPDDCGSLIGARGRVISGIRDLCRALSSRFEHSIMPRLIEANRREPNNDSHRKRRRVRKDPPDRRGYSR